MRTTSKIVLAIILIILVYSLAKLISASSMGAQQPSIRTWPVSQDEEIMQNRPIQTTAVNQTNTQNTSQEETSTTPTAPTVPNVPPTPDTPNAQGLYQADEILINGQGKAGSNYIDITSDTPITPQPQNTNNTQNNNYSGGGAYAQASVNIDNNNNTSTSVQTYAPGVPAFEVLDGN